MNAIKTLVLQLSQFYYNIFYMWLMEFTAAFCMQSVLSTVFLVPCLVSYRAGLSTKTQYLQESRRSSAAVAKRLLYAPFSPSAFETTKRGSQNSNCSPSYFPNMFCTLKGQCRTFCLSRLRKVDGSCAFKLMSRFFGVLGKTTSQIVNHQFLIITPLLGDTPTNYTRFALSSIIPASTLVSQILAINQA